MNFADTTEFNVAIAGAGPSGASMAIRLAKAGLRVVLLEQKRFPRDKLCGEFISPECLVHFRELGIDVGATGAVPIEEAIFYTHQGTSVNIPSRWLGRTGATALGLSRSTMDNLLLQRALELGVEVRDGTRVKELLYCGANVVGLLARAAQVDMPVRASIIVDARGRSGGFNVVGDRTRQAPAAKYVAFKTHLAGARTAAGTCEMFLYRGGYGGCLPVEDGCHNLCFIAPASVVISLQHDPERVLRELVMTNRRASEVLADARPVTRWQAVPIPPYGTSCRTTLGGVLAIGDAAAFIDPFTGSGILLALESAKIASEIILTNQKADLKMIAQVYQERYRQSFGRRLRSSSMLRYAISAPRLAATVISMIGSSQGLLRRAAEATRSRVAPGG